MSSCPYCQKGFRSPKALQAHLVANSHCQSLLSAHIPPVPSLVQRPISSTTIPTRRSSARYSSADRPESIAFPDDLSDFPMNHDLDESVPPDPSVTADVRHLFQIPSEIIERALNLNLSNDNDSQDDYDQEFNLPLLSGPPASSTVAPLPAVSPLTIDTTFVESSPTIKKGYVLGSVHQIACNEDFDMLDAFPGSLVSMTRIIHYCRKAAVPLYLVDGILKIISEEVSANRLNLLDPPSSRSTMKDLKQLFAVPVPRMVAIPLERTLLEQANAFYPRSPTFPTFSFLEQLQDLLSMSDIFRDIDNLVVNDDNPWLPYNPPGNRGDEMHDGDWFRNARCTPSDPMIFDLGIILYTDKTGMGQLNPHGMEPLVFTLTLFREHIRQRPDCWRPLGFVPQFRKNSSADERVQKQSKTTTGRLVRNYHGVLDTLLAGIVECQNSPPIVRIRIGNEWKFVRVNIILEAILGDALSNDVICGRVQSRSGSPRLCRACHIPQEFSHDTRHCCKFLVQRHMERITLSALGPETDSSNENYFNQWDAFVDEKVTEAGDRTDSFKKSLRHKYAAGLRRRMNICTQILRVVLGSHVVDNAFYRVSCGNNPRGVFGATPTDPMHAVEEGWIPNFLEVVIAPLPDSAKRMLDTLVESLFCKKSNRSSQRSNYPRISFSGGFSSLSQLSADEKVGKLFALALIAETPVGKNILLQRCDPEFDAKRKDRAKRFQGFKSNNTLDPGDDVSEAEEEQVETALSPQEEIEHNTRFSKMKFNPDDDEHIGYVHSQLRRHGLAYMIPFLAQMSNYHSVKAKSIVWAATRSLIKDTNYSTDQVEIPNSEDVSVAPEWRHCPDRRAQLFSNATSHPDTEFYASNPVEGNTPDSNKGLDELPLPRYSIDCETIEDLTEIIQLFLSFHAFYKYGASVFGSKGLLVTDMKIRDMLSKLQSRVDRGDGTKGWAISKFHDTLHMAMDMQLFGCSENIDTSKGEHGLKIWAKLPSRTTQTSHGANKFIEQLANRLYEQTLLDKAYSVLVPHHKKQSKGRALLELPTFAIQTALKSSFRIDGHMKKHKNQNIDLDLDFLQWFGGKQNKVANRPGVIVFARLFLQEFDGLTFRASPDYLGTGPWYDWVLVVFLDSSEQQIYYPYKIKGFVEKDDGSGPTCFGQMCAMQTKNEKETSAVGLFEHWHLETRPNSTDPVYRFVEIDSIADPCLAFQLTTNSMDEKNPSTDFTNRVIVVKDRQKLWPGIFMKGIGRTKKSRKTSSSRKKRR